MIHPNMATMLAFVTTDVAIAPALLQKAVSEVVDDTFNMVSVDGDTSTNDMLSVLANGLAGQPMIITEETPAYQAFHAGAVCRLSKSVPKKLAGDGEGRHQAVGMHRPPGARSRTTAKKVAKSVICSSLFKAAMFGADANWGRILCAIGYTDAAFDIDQNRRGSLPRKRDASYVCENGAGVPFSEEDRQNRTYPKKKFDVRYRYERRRVPTPLPGAAI